MSRINLVFILGLSLLSCGRIENSSSQDKALYSPRAGGSAQYEAAVAIIAAKCAECHGAWMSYTDSDYVMTGLVIPNNPTGSKIYYRNQLGPGPQNNMPSQGRPAATSDEMQTLATWINSISL